MFCDANLPFCFSLILLFLQCVRGLQGFFEAVGNLDFARMWFVFCSPVCLIQGLSLLQQCYLTQHCKKTNRWSDRVVERRGRDWLLLNTEHQRGYKPPCWCHHLPLIWRPLFGVLKLWTSWRISCVLVFVCIINPALMSCGKDVVSWWSACWAHRWAQTRRSHFLTPPITFVPGAVSKGSTGEPGDKRSWGTGGRGGAVWVRTNDMAHLRVLDCMVSHKWSRICDLYCAFNSQVCAAFLHIYCSAHEINCSVHVFKMHSITSQRVALFCRYS